MLRCCGTCYGVEVFLIDDLYTIVSHALVRSFPISENIVVVGLGYVGLPLAIALANKFSTCGLDIDASRIDELNAANDRTGEIDAERLKASSLTYVTSADACPKADIYILTIPTPVDSTNTPDLGPLLAATRAVASVIDPARKPIIVYESTVYPGVTEEICGPEIERISGLKAGKDFFLGYSPERINPGDREHTIDRIIKVVAGQNDDVTERLAKMYGAITSGGVFRAKSIKVAEAAKVIENTQRDVNIALMNEISQIFSKMDISVWDVLEAARTKWNFLPFQPGLVGGHCIGVDPYYLSFRAEELGHDPVLILAGRSTNDGMAAFVAEQIHKFCGEKTGDALVLGLTFKEDVPDLRNSKVIDLIAGLTALGHRVTAHDPIADPTEALAAYGISIDQEALGRSYPLVVLAVPHSAYLNMGVERIFDLVAPQGALADPKAAFDKAQSMGSISYWTL